METINDAPIWLHAAQERGYKEALLDMYCYLTGDEQILEYPERLELIENMINQVNAKPNRLSQVG